jgi:hypothetical protein
MIIFLACLLFLFLYSNLVCLELALIVLIGLVSMSTLPIFTNYLVFDLRYSGSYYFCYLISCLN